MRGQDSDMSFLDHLEIFRWHLIRSTFVIVLFSIVSFMFKGVIFDVILLAPSKPNFQTYLFLCKASHLLGMSDALCLRESPFTLININMSGQFSTHILVSFLILLGVQTGAFFQ